MNISRQQISSVKMMYSSDVSSILFLIDVDLCDRFFENLSKIVLTKKNKFPSFFLEKTKFYNLCPPVSNRWRKFGFDLFGFSHGRVYRSKKYLQIKIKINGVGVKDIHFTLFSIFASLIVCAKKQRSRRSHEIEILSSINIVPDSGTLFGTYPKEYEKMKMIEKKVTDAMSHAWMSLIPHEMESKISPDCGITVYESGGEFALFCSPYQVCNLIVELDKKMNLRCTKIDVSDSVRSIVLFAGLAKLCSIF